MTEVEQIQTNGIDNAEDENNKSRPADIEAVCVLMLIFYFFNVKIFLFFFQIPTGYARNGTT